MYEYILCALIIWKFILYYLLVRFYTHNYCTNIHNNLIEHFSQSFIYPVVQSGRKKNQLIEIFSSYIKKTSYFISVAMPNMFYYFMNHDYVVFDDDDDDEIMLKCSFYEFIGLFF